ncbi:hypothetical protein DFH06DRAFT_1300232, partial [Mycena polygramma]
MSPQSAVTQIRLNNIITCLAVTADSLELLARGLKEPSLEAISYVTGSLLRNVKTIRQNKIECIQLLEQTHGLLNAVLEIHLKSDTGVDLAPGVLNHIGKFTEYSTCCTPSPTDLYNMSRTLNKVHTYIETQQKGSIIKRLLHQSDLGTLFKGCIEGLQQGLHSLRVDMGKITRTIADIQKESEARHEEVLSLIEALSDASSDQASTISKLYCGPYNSSTSISMLPSEPKIFHGRDSELDAILQLFGQGTPRIAILGAGGMGKTTVAQALLHHPQITHRYGQHRYFIACDAATTTIELIALIGPHLELKVDKDLTHAVVQHFCNSPPSLLVLDNLETVWEQTESRNEVEEFLSLLTDVKHLALIVTMRGLQRPGKVAWTRPFLRPLSPLDQHAAYQTFIDIADDVHNPEQVHKVLALTDNMPLALSLLAHLVDSEGCSTVLLRWQEERTSLISDGWDRKSNLDLSISLSLSSPRLRAFPHTHKLLSLLSMLPNGLSDLELMQSELPIQNILGCKAVLTGTSLAYNDPHGRIKVLVPIREYMQKFQPPEDELYFQELLELHKEYQGTPSASGTVARISLNLANIQIVIQKGLHRGHPDLVDCIYCTCYVNQFSRLGTQGAIPLIKQISHVFPLPTTHLEAYVTTEFLHSWHYYPGKDLETLISRASTHFEKCHDSNLKCSFYLSLAFIYRDKRDFSTALNFTQLAISLATSSGNTKKHSQALRSMAWTNFRLGNYAATQAYAKESQRLARISGDLWGEASGLCIEVPYWLSLGHYNQSLSLCYRARDLLTACGMSNSELNLNIMNMQAEVHKLKAEYILARDIYHQICQETTVTQHPRVHSLALINIAQIDVWMDIARDAVYHTIGTVRETCNARNHVMGTLTCDIVLADLTLREGDMCLERLANVSHWNFSSETNSWATVSLAHASKFNVKPLFYKALLSLGQIFYRQADSNTATSLFKVALEGFTYMDIHCSRAECMLYLGDIAMGCGDLPKAVELWDTAKPLFGRAAQGKQVKNIDERLASISESLLEQHRQSLTYLAELNAPLPAPSGAMEEAEDELSDIEGSDVVEEEEGDPLLV